VAFVNHNEIEKLDGQFRIVANRQGLATFPADFRGVGLFCFIIQFFFFKNRIQALNRADINLIVGRHKTGFQSVHTVEFGKLAVIIIGHIGHELLFGLLAQVSGIDQK